MIFCPNICQIYNSVIEGVNPAEYDTSYIQDRLAYKECDYPSQFYMPHNGLSFWLRIVEHRLGWKSHSSKNENVNAWRVLGVYRHSEMFLSRAFQICTVRFSSGNFYGQPMPQTSFPRKSPKISALCGLALLSIKVKNSLTLLGKNIQGSRTSSL